MDACLSDVLLDSTPTMPCAGIAHVASSHMKLSSITLHCYSISFLECTGTLRLHDHHVINVIIATLSEEHGEKFRDQQNSEYVCIYKLHR